jgi:putative acetyltransferase
MTEQSAPNADIIIVPFAPRHARAFHDLNVAWVERYFTVEQKDREQLEDPEGRIINKGGMILIAEDETGAAIGCVSLVPYAEGVLELAKMAVADNVQGRGVGRKLMDATVAKARELGARELYLESNSSLGPAVRLYERSGFEHLPSDKRPHSPYARCDVYMRLSL